MKKYWTAEIYGFGKWIRRYGFYPDFLPLCIYTDHGIVFEEQAAKHELESDAPVILFHSHIKVKNFRETNNKPCFILYSAFVFARKALKIEQKKDAKGSIFFWGHSTQVVVDQRDVEDYHQELTKIPEIFKPVTICLHIHDINHGIDKKLKKLGYQVVTAGNSSEENFAERFYRILSEYKYAISNTIGSYTFYAVEMGIPFGIYGTEPEYFNYGDPNIESGEYISYKELDGYKKALVLFSGLPDKVTEAQKEFVDEYLGIKYGLSRSKMAVVLYRSFLQWIFNLKNLQEFIIYCFNRFKNYIKPFANKILDFNLRKLLKKVGFKNIDKPKAILLKYKEIEDFIMPSEYKRIKESPRYTFTRVQFLGHELGIVDNASFLEMIKELFAEEIYDFEAKTELPYIIDCGANVGLSVIYFKRLYPKSQIVAIEADPNIYKILKQNVDLYNLTDVQCINSAVWTNSETVNFAAEGSWGGYLSSEINSNNIEVKALDLRKLINRKIDFLKIDIEGAETEVLIHTQDLIVKYVENLFFEWHSLTQEPQQLGKILDYFSNNGFRYHIKEAGNRINPFINKTTSRMDSQLNCFLYKIH